MKHHLSKENIDSDRGKSLDILMGDEIVDIESILFFIGLSLGMVKNDSTSWKDFVYSEPKLCEIVHDLLFKLIDNGLIKQIEKCEDDYTEYFYQLIKG